ncbi:unnamed protein product [Dracunculus medinensis]|uniref:Kunitz/Bovine pancreatic trypsin inhibitor domain protein n=1 Tax=Dracunculus medinensis TaxID=318479 RepID=A0A0N4UQN1_DRAME|nr:unnamed protein product [Dracunculus medinensis]
MSRSLKSYFFSKMSFTQCELFYWSGCCENRNNFETFQNCWKTCEEPLNPCAYGTTESRIQFSNICGVQQFCHIGATIATTICCNKPRELLTLASFTMFIYEIEIHAFSRQGIFYKAFLFFVNLFTIHISANIDRCNQPLHVGIGNTNLQRWYFNSVTQQCQTFAYQGLQGNENNFLTQQECEASCFGTHCCFSNLHQLKSYLVNCLGIYINLYYGTGNQNHKSLFSQEKQLKKHQGIFLQCSATNQQIMCPNGYFCHIGANAQTTVCCQILGKISSAHEMKIAFRYQLRKSIFPIIPFNNFSKKNIVSGNDACIQVVDAGRGNAQLQRWYWNVVNRQCMPFLYNGLMGNQNNFISKQICENACYVPENPCALGQPQLSPDKRFLSCNTGPNICSSGYWCHIGTIKNTVCCPGQVIGDAICKQPMAVGTGQANLQRWYFNEATQKCIFFIYNGLFGNQNNFLTEQQCEQSCPGFINPCNLPLIGAPQFCSPSSNNCGQRSYCHIGANAQTTLCCPSEGNICTLPMATGNGANILERWYFNQQAEVCQIFIYSGVKGNQNNFLTRQECEEICPPNPCLEGSPMVRLDGKWQGCNANSLTNSCIGNYWCHLGARPLTTVCCPGANANPCNLPLAAGEGNANVERFYYDILSRSCRTFVYKGLKGNQNNFLTLGKCRLQCEALENPCSGQPATTEAGHVIFCSSTNKDTCPVNFWCHVGSVAETTVCCPGATNPCSVPLAPGTGNDGLSRWYYSADDRTCLPFQYNGRRGNQNNFESQAECSRTCPAELCLLSVDPGACGGRQTRYAFNRQSNQCTPFQYTGCGGNLNNFNTMEDCMATCGNIGFRKT